MEALPHEGITKPQYMIALEYYSSTFFLNVYSYEKGTNPTFEVINSNEVEGLSYDDTSPKPPYFVVSKKEKNYDVIVHHNDSIFLFNLDTSTLELNAVSRLSAVIQTESLTDRKITEISSTSDFVYATGEGFKDEDIEFLSVKDILYDVDGGTRNVVSFDDGNVLVIDEAGENAIILSKLGATIGLKHIDTGLDDFDDSTLTKDGYALGISHYAENYVKIDSKGYVYKKGSLTNSLEKPHGVFAGQFVSCYTSMKSGKILVANYDLDKLKAYNTHFYDENMKYLGAQS